MDKEKIHLEMTASVKNDRLQVKYVLSNQSNQTLVVFDGARGIGEGEYPDMTGQCYVSFAPPSTARVLRIRPPAHPFMETTSTFMPAASQVQAGQERIVKFSLQLPLKERSQFSPEFAGAVYAVQPVGELELRLGCFWKTPETKLAQRAPGVFMVLQGAPLSQTFEITSGYRIAFDMSIRKDADFIRM